MLPVLFLFALVSSTSAQVSCSSSGNLGPCLTGQCPSSPPATCINQGTASEMCCDNTQIISAPPTTTPPPPPTTVPVVTVQQTTVIIPGQTTAAPTGACVDLLNPSTGVSDCPGLAYLLLHVDDPTMSQDLWKMHSFFGCADLINPSTGVSDCPSRAYLCNNSTYYTLMTQQCPKTCGRCSSTGTSATATSTCADKLNPSTGVSDCPGMASYCQYVSLMQQQCPRTCGYCTGK